MQRSKLPAGKLWFWLLAIPVLFALAYFVLVFGQ
jgi:hypothetical protein